MTDRKRIIFKMEGTAENNGHLELSVFEEKIKQFLGLLKSSVKDSSEDGIVFQVVNLSHSSPATIECEPIGKNKLPSTPTFYRVVKNLESVEAGQTRKLSHDTFGAMERLAQYNPKKIARVEIQTVGNDEEKAVYQLDKQFRKKLDEGRSLEETLVNTIDGKLEQINIHNNTNTFKIYTFVTPVTCKFPNALLGDVQNALGSFVSVWGKCSYRPDTKFPYKIDVRKMDILPPSEDLPSLLDLHGIAPNATGEKSSEQFVRELRDKWNKDAQ